GVVPGGCAWLLWHRLPSAARLGTTGTKPPGAAHAPPRGQRDGAGPLKATSASNAPSSQRWPQALHALAIDFLHLALRYPEAGGAQPAGLGAVHLLEVLGFHQRAEDFPPALLLQLVGGFFVWEPAAAGPQPDCDAARRLWWPARPGGGTVVTSVFGGPHDQE